MKKWVQRAWCEIWHGKNLDLYVTIAAGLIATMMDLIGNFTGNTSQVTSAIGWAVLAFLAIGVLENRHRMDSLSRTSADADRKLGVMDSILQRMSLPASPSLGSRKDILPLENYAPQVRDILMVGYSLGTVLRVNGGFLRERLRDGITVRLVVLDPKDKNLCETVAPLLDLDALGLSNDVSNSLTLIKGLAEGIQGTGKLAVHFIPYVPTLSLVALDVDSPTGHIIVEMQPYGVDAGSRPHLLVKGDETPNWFDYFGQVAKRLWSGSSVYSEWERDSTGKLVRYVPDRYRTL